MRSTLPILICCLYALSAVDATPFSKVGSAEVQQGNAKAAKPLKFWSNDKIDDKDDRDDKWSKNDHYDQSRDDDCASRSVSILIGTSTYAIPCMSGGNIVNLNGLIPTSPIGIVPSASSTINEASSSVVSSSVASSSAVASSSSAASSSEASSTTDTTTTTTATWIP